MEFFNFTKIGLQDGRTKNFLTAAAFSTLMTRTELPRRKNKNHESGNTTYHKWLFRNPFLVRSVHLPIFYWWLICIDFLFIFLYIRCLYFVLWVHTHAPIKTLYLLKSLKIYLLKSIVRTIFRTFSVSNEILCSLK